ncbi:MAG: MarR family transcriptional regulator [Christensenellaceae bacterium]|nr:MarR family transcriptional regulator [Christensenellaceae bacterium]
MPKITRDLNVLARCSVYFRGRSFEKIGISANQYSYILSVINNPGITQDGLSKLLFVNKSNAARQLKELEQNGFIIRKQGQDKRVMYVYPTEKAEEIKPEILRVLREWNSLITEGMTEEELALLEKMLDRITDRAKDYVQGKERQCTP